MIIVLKKGADKKQVEGLLNWLRERNISPHVSTGERETLIGCVMSRIDWVFSSRSVFMALLSMHALNRKKPAPAQSTSSNAPHTDKITT